MTDDHVQIAPDGSGKKLQTFKNTVAGEDVHAEGVTLVDSAGSAITITNPLFVSAGTSVFDTIDLIKIGGSAVGATNGLFVSAATGAVFPVSGTVTPSNTSATGLFVSAATGALFPVSDNSGSLTVDVNGTAVSATNGVFVSAATGATFPVSGTVTATVADGLKVSAATGSLFPVNVSQVGGTAVGATNGLYVSAATGATFPVSGTVTASTLHNVKVYQSSMFSSATFPLTIVAALANKVCKVHKYSLQCSAATGACFYFMDGANAAATAAISQHWTLQGREGVVDPFVPAPGYLFKTTANTLLAISADSAVHIDGHIIFSLDDAS